MRGELKQVIAQDGTQCVLKAVDGWADPEVAQLLMETRAPGLPRCYGISDEMVLAGEALPEKPHYLFEYVEGVTLRSIPEDLLSSHNLEQLFFQILDVLAWIRIVSRKDFAHLDISPENIIVTEDRQAVLIDFQASRFLGSESNARDASRVITAGYAAPEVYFGTMRPETDLYSLAMTILAVLSGQMASGLDRSTMRHNLKRLDRSFAERLRHCLSEDPNDRRQAVTDTLYGQSLEVSLSRYERSDLANELVREVENLEDSCPYVFSECPFLKVAEIMFEARE